MAGLVVRAVLLALVILSGPPPAGAAPGRTGAPPPARPAAASPSSLAAPLPTDAYAPSGTVTIFNREIVTLRAPFLGISAPVRAERAQDALARILERGGEGVVAVREIPEGYAILVDNVPAFLVAPGDEDPAKGETLDQSARGAADALRLVVRETREARSFASLLRSLGVAGAATAALLLAVLALHRIRLWIAERLAAAATRKPGRLAALGASLLGSDRLAAVTRKVGLLAYGSVVVLLVFEWAGFVLTRFPYTRPWGEQLSHSLLGVVLDLGLTLLRGIPGLLVAAAILYGAKLATGFLRSVFERIERGEFSIAGLDRDTARPTWRVLAAGAWIFALAMAYPYLPGSETAAFKGLSVLAGVMVSLGGANLVGQAASGMILMYTKTLRPGEYVRVADTEGTVTELGLFTTRIRSGLDEEITLPNSFILGSVTRNCSRGRGEGYALSATVTIGYDAPWRQVHAMLAEAARRTAGVLPDPAPRVFQTALGDFYPEYRLVCHAAQKEPRARAEARDALYANIQDVFNENGVQIMSPHYVLDPAKPKVVPQEGWSPPLVRRDG